MLPRTVVMQRARHQFFSRPVLTLDQDCAIRVGYLPNQSVNLLHSPTCADKILEFVFVTRPAFESVALAQKGLILQGPHYAVTQFIPVEWLCNIVVRP